MGGNQGISMRTTLELLTEMGTSRIPPVERTKCTVAVQRDCMSTEGQLPVATALSALLIARYVESTGNTYTQTTGIEGIV